jgi:hypothetical protein
VTVRAERRFEQHQWVVDYADDAVLAHVHIPGVERVS